MVALIAFLVVIGVLVTFHELGHYLVAKLCGVKVLRFSIGFGKVLFTYRTKETEWALSMIPLGGYVKMLDEREGDVAEDEKSRAFNNQKVWKRMLIVAAGPIANFLIAIALLFVVMSQGVMHLKPMVGSVMPESAAHSAGILPNDKILTINNQNIQNWSDIRDALTSGIVNQNELLITADQNGVSKAFRLDLNRFGLNQLDESSLGKIGILPIRFTTKLEMVEKGGAAEQAGLRKGDELKTLNGKPINAWTDWVYQIQNHPGALLMVTGIRDDEPFTVALRPQTVQRGEDIQGKIGAAPTVDVPWMTNLTFKVNLTPWQTFQVSVDKTYHLATSSLKMMWGMLAGNVSLNAISGPVTIASFAGKTAQEGMNAYLEFMALISISLGVLNLLPIPVLDGGHLLYYTAELIRGRPLSLRVQEMGQRFGLMIIMLLMMVALFNDLGRLLGG